MNSYISIFIALIALIVSLGIYVNFKTTTKKSNNYTASNIKDYNEQLQTQNEDFELAVYMNQLQTHANKLWFSGINKNWDLATFYLNELEESMNTIEKANIEEDGINISPLIRNFGINSLTMISASIQKKDTTAFKENYKMLVTNCNGCHNASQHSFIKISIPTKPVFDNQDYTAN